MNSLSLRTFYVGLIGWLVDLVGGDLRKTHLEPYHWESGRPNGNVSWDRLVEPSTATTF